MKSIIVEDTKCYFVTFRLPVCKEYRTLVFVTDYEFCELKGKSKPTDAELRKAILSENNRRGTIGAIDNEIDP
jgi:hypothetical protein